MPHTFETDRLVLIGDYGYPFLENYYNIWTNRHHLYNFSGKYYIMNCLTAHNKRAKLYGIYDSVHQDFYSKACMTGA